MTCGSCGALNSTQVLQGGGWPTLRTKLTKMQLGELKAMATKLKIDGRSKATSKKSLIDLIFNFKNKK